LEHADLFLGWDRARPRRSLHIYMAHARGLRAEAGADVQRSEVSFRI